VKNLYKFEDEKLPIKAFCFVIKSDDDKNQTISISRDIEILVKFCCARIIPHNIFFTYGSSNNEIRILFYVRTSKHVGTQKTYGDFAIVAACELVGHLPEASLNVFENFTEEMLVSRLNEEIGNVPDDIEPEILKLYEV
jgi:hypothetical protein